MKQVVWEFPNGKKIVFMQEDKNKIYEVYNLRNAYIVLSLAQRASKMVHSQLQHESVSS